MCSVQVIHGVQDHHRHSGLLNLLHTRLELSLATNKITTQTLLQAASCAFASKQISFVRELWLTVDEGGLEEVSEVREEGT